ncbi:hypothetical protein GGR56DRAFT_37433 [Xylariaceae sp. FL0804]|nr:hypothetical protein GGR56DRAFT_37433 [Xylariaceae sp. FL0804]
MTTDFSKLKVVELKAELKRLGLPQNGLKAELVSRLEAAASDDADNNADDNADNDSPQPAPEEPTASVGDEVLPEPVRDPQPPPPATSTQAQDVSADAEPQTEGAKSPEPADTLQDKQKRKRRSTTPPPSADEVARKRPRNSSVVGGDNDEDEAIASAGTGGGVEGNKTGTDLNIPNAATDSQMEEAELETKEPGSRQAMDDPSRTENGIEQEGEKLKGHAANKIMQNGYSPDRAMVDSDNVAMLDRAPLEEPTPRVPASPRNAYEPERDVDPSMHPATSALYIRNFMRPLRSQAVRDYLVELATPAGSSIDERVVVDFYLDNIRTHAFAVFDSISAASRVRTSLHARVWPDETNRKPLWVDFMPPERFEDWVNMELSTGRRGSTSRYEVVYDDDRDGNVTATLEEGDAGAPASRQAPPASPPSGGRPSAPSGPARSFGIEHAPTGPRSYQAPGPETAMHPARLQRSEPTLSTRTFPVINYQPVPDELAQRRLDVIAAAKAPESRREFGKEYKRYYFEKGEFLVDRGPEIFLGIRPPHRERERRREQARGFPSRGGRGAAGGGGPMRRRPMPTPHGRFGGEERPRYGDERPRYGDERPRYGDERPRFGDDRGRRGGYGRY